MATKKATKQVTVIARYAHKTNNKLNGIVTYAVRSSNGKDIYCTTVINGKTSGCSCPAHKPCYHMTQLEQKELDRKVAVAPVVEVAPVVVIEEVAPVVEETAACQEYRMSDALYAKLKATAPVEPKPTSRIITVPGPKKERFDLVGHLTEKREHKAALLGEISKIKARKRSEDIGLKGNFGNRGFRLMR